MVLISLLLRSCAPQTADAAVAVNRPDEQSEELRGVWLSQFDMTKLYLKNGVQRPAGEFDTLARQMTANLAREGINTVFLQMRPNGDSMCESSFFPYSRYLTGAYGRSAEYDAIARFISIAKADGLSVHAWINPFRLMTAQELEAVGDCTLMRWYKRADGRIVEVGGRLYLNPAFPEVRSIIADGAAELLRKYRFDGLHIDDYFYPTEDSSFDRLQYVASGFTDLGDFRRSNITATVQKLYNTTKSVSDKLVFGVSPAGNLRSLYNGHYVDIKAWLALGCVDYIIPQLYYGFENAYCPFEKTLEEWTAAMASGSAKLYIGLSAEKAQRRERDVFAGSEEGKREWIENGDVLERELAVVEKNANCHGWCLFSYSNLFDPITGEKKLL